MAQILGKLALQFAIQRAFGEGGVFTKSGRIGVDAALRRRAARQKVDAEYVGGIEPRRRLYGNFRASGLNCMPAVTTDFGGLLLHKCLALSDGPIESIDAVHFNNDRLEFAIFEFGPIVSGTYAGYAQIFSYLGAASQAANPTATGVPGWSTEHRGDGVAYVYMFFQYSPEIWKGGPPLVLVEGKGVKVYDPRLDTSPGANPLNTTYHAFTTCPPLILADFLIWGGNELPANIIWDDVVAAANICDEDVAIPGSATKKRYTCSTEVYSPLTLAERDQTIIELAKSMMGHCWFSGGKWNMRAGAYSTPVGTINEGDFLGDSVHIIPSKSRSDGGIFNTVRGTFVDEVQATQPKGFPEVSTPSYVAEDGEVIYADAEFKTARTAYEAQRNGIQMMRRSRQPCTVAGTLRFRGRKFRLYDIVNVNISEIGWVSQTAMVVASARNQDFTVNIELEKVRSTDFTDPDPADYIQTDSISPPTSADYTPNPPTNFSAISQASAIVFTWDPPLNAPIGVLYQLFEHSSPTPFSSATRYGSDTAQTSIGVPRTTTTTSYWWVRAKDPATGAVSITAPPLNGLPAQAATASSALGAIVVPGSASALVYTATAATPSVTVTATGGTAPYTYAWTFTSGGTGITIDSATSAITTFSAAGLAAGDLRSGTARCRVTDNVSATYDVFVTVSIERGYSVDLIDETVQSYGGSISAAVSSWVINPAGSISKSDGTSRQWLDPAASASAYEVRFTLTGGALQSGTTGVWLAVTTGRGIVGARNPGQGVGTSVQTVNVEARLIAAPGAILDSCTVTLAETII